MAAAYKSQHYWRFLRAHFVGKLSVRFLLKIIAAEKIADIFPDIGNRRPLGRPLPPQRPIHPLAIFGICLGLQLLGLDFGGKTYKLRFGHRGANQPVLNRETGKVEITSQNHGFAVDAATLSADVEVTHINLNDQTVEGIRHKKFPAFGVQYHPEAAPGPYDSHYLFSEFLQMMQGAAV